MFHLNIVRVPHLQRDPFFSSVYSCVVVVDLSLFPFRFFAPRTELSCDRHAHATLYGYGRRFRPLGLTELAGAFHRPSTVRIPRPLPA